MASSQIYDVAVVGAGLCGLICARDLTACGLTVVLLEANDRVGGRVFTRTRAGVAEDLGAEWVQPRVHPLMLAELARYGLELEPGSEAGGGDSSSEAGSEVDALYAAIDADAARVPRAALYGPDLAPLDIPWAAYLRAKGTEGAAGVVEDASFPFSGTHPAHLSALYMLREAAQFGGARGLFTESEARVRGGAGALPAALAAALGGAVRLGCPVVRVTVPPSSALVEVACGGSAGGDQPVLARRVVVTVPLNALGRLAFSPPLPSSAVAASREGHAGHALKAHVDAGAGCPPPGAHRLVFPGRSAGRATVIALPGDAVAAAAAAGASGHSHDWSADPWAAGTWCAPRVGQLAALEELRTAASGPLVWVTGADVTPMWPGWMEGAVAAGQLAASQVQSSLKA